VLDENTVHTTSKLRLRISFISGRPKTKRESSSTGLDYLVLSISRHEIRAYLKRESIV